MHCAYPLLLKPVYQPYIWGGDRIVRRFHRDEPPGVYAESWEVSDRPEGMSVVENGPLAGRSFADLLKENGPEIRGRAGNGPTFPLLIKLIDARETLSVQVHPNDETARRYGGEAKTEMWYVLEADEGACVYAGLNPGTTEASFRQGIAEGTLDRQLTSIPVQPGDAIFMPGGRVHAIGAGCLLLEVQQNSNTTYRLYDWGRVGTDGKPRELHIEEALRVIQWEDEESAKVPARQLAHTGPNERGSVCTSPYFQMERWILRETQDLQLNGQSFEVYFCAQEDMHIECPAGRFRIPAGRSCLIPAALRTFTIQPSTKTTEVLRIRYPE